MSSSSGFYDPSTAPYFDPRTDRHVAFITGANVGIGWYNALHLYLHGHIVYIGGRTESKVLKAIDDIKKEATVRASKADPHPVGELHYQHLDLLDLSTVATAAETVGAKEPKIDTLILNAGLMAVHFEVTKDNYEIQYQANVAGHFLLIHKLLPNLQAVATAGGTPRVVHLSSTGHLFSFKYFDPASFLATPPNFITTWVRYGAAKTAVIQNARSLAMKYPDILSISVHPGVIVDSELYRYWKNLPYLGPLFNTAFRLAGSLVGIGLEEGSLAAARAAMDPTLTPAKDNGKYFIDGGIESSPSWVSTNDENAKRTWDWNVEQLKARGFW